MPGIVRGIDRALSDSENDALNLYCLKLCYPSIKKLVADPAGDRWLLLANGAKVPYALSGMNTSSPLHVDARASMGQIYPLEPRRPDTPPGFAPGRLRPYQLFEQLYGDSPLAVQKGLEKQAFPGQSLALHSSAAKAFAKARPALLALAARSPHFRQYLKSDGGYYWRPIAGENVLSAHSFGIALDMGANRAPYWRWTPKRPHPLQKSYPGEIVSEFEKHGFIWGGKWHEFDMMHFEYRPELICKARMLDKFKIGPLKIGSAKDKWH